MLRYRFVRAGCPLLSAAAILSGCVNVPQDRGLSDVSALTQQRGTPVVMLTGDDTEADRTVERLLDAELTIQDALRIALLRSPRMRVEYARLGIASADVLQAGRLSNPTLSWSALRPDASGQATQVGFGFAQSFTDILLLPSRTRLAEGEFERAKLEAGAAIIALTRDVEHAYFTLVGAQQVAAMRGTVAKSATASANLAQRFYDAGNITELALNVESAAAAEAERNELTAAMQVSLARASLNELMGLPATETRWTVGSGLQLPVAEEDDLSTLQTLAVQQRLDRAAAAREVALLEDALGIAKKFRYLGNAEVGVETERETDRIRITGPTLALQLPIFNQNQSGVMRAQSSLELAAANLTALEIEISNGVALGHSRVQTARHSVELYRQRLVPMRERIVQRTQEEVNYMLVGVFDLIRAKQDEYDGYQGYLEAVRDYWLSRTELAFAIGGPLPSSSEPSEEVVAPELPVAAPETNPHAHHRTGGMTPMAPPESRQRRDHAEHPMHPSQESVTGQPPADATRPSSGHSHH